MINLIKMNVGKKLKKNIIKDFKNGKKNEYMIYGILFCYI